MYCNFGASSSLFAEKYNVQLRAPLTRVDLQDFSGLVEVSLAQILLSAARMILSLGPQRDTENGAHKLLRPFICRNCVISPENEVLCDYYWRIGDLHSNDWLDH